MNAEKYSEKIRSLIQAEKDQSAAMDQAVFDTLQELLALAFELDDNELIGYAEYYLAVAYFTFGLGYEKYRTYLKRALRHLTIAQDYDALAKAFSLVGIDALMNGVYDVAFMYFSTGRDICVEQNDLLQLAKIDHNTGTLFLELGDYEQSLFYTRKSRRVMEKANDDMYFCRNMITVHYSEGMLCLNLNDIDGAKDADQKIREYEEQDIAASEFCAVLIYFFRAKLAYLQRHESEASDYLYQALKLIKGDPQSYYDLEDIYHFTMFLIESGHEEEAPDLITLIQDTFENEGNEHTKRLFADMRIAYYEKVGDEEKLQQILRERHDYEKKMSAMRNQTYLFSTEMIAIMNDLRRNMQKTKRENELLHVMAGTDELTGLPNRYQMNLHMEAAFEKAYRAGTPIAIGIIDVDDFKHYNDTYGHRAGDACLKAVARAIGYVTKEGKVFCARYGGDEFVMIYEDMSEQELRDIATALERTIRVSVSQGICIGTPRNKNKTWDYLSEADATMYELKQEKKAGQTSDTVRIKKSPYS